MSDATPLLCAIPCINYSALEYLECKLSDQSSVLEWGMGGSTIFFAMRCFRVICNRA